MEYLACTSCQTQQYELAEPLKKCTRCRSQRYCSRNCQEADWPRHKLICEERPAGEADPPMKASLSFNMGSQLGRPREDLSGIIYYLRTSQPHIHDVTISGPYYPIGMIRPQMLQKLGETSHAAFMYFHEAFPDDTAGEGPIGLTNWGRLIGPLDNNPRHTIKVELLTEHNPAIAATLPRPCYRIMFSKCKQLPGTKTEQFRRVFGYGPLKDMEIHGAFLDRDKAEAAARRVLKEKLEEFPGSQETVMGWQVDEFICAITKKGGSGTSEIQAIIQAHYDTGRTDYEVI